MKYYIIAGESSGDLHASNLMKEIRLRDRSPVFRCWGGDRMQAQGAEIVKHYRELAFMGFIKVLMNIRTIMGNLKLCREDILIFKPDVVILVDYPGFNLRMAKFAHQQGFKVFYYVSPQVWAWKRSRMKKIKKNVDRMFVILPFEKEFYMSYGYDVDFVGHPLLDAIPGREACMSREAYKKRFDLDERPIIALLPGSRKQEISKMLSVMLEMTQRFSRYQFVIAGEPSIELDFYDKFIHGQDVRIVYSQLPDLLYNAEAALVTSGTATLEAAITGTPEVVCYKGGNLSYLIARMIVDVKYISLVNLIMDQPVVKELVQFDLNAKSLAGELDRLLSDREYRNKMKHDFAVLKDKLGGPGASAKTAELMMNALGT